MNAPYLRATLLTFILLTQTAFVAHSFAAFPNAEAPTVLITGANASH